MVDFELRQSLRMRHIRIYFYSSISHAPQSRTIPRGCRAAATITLTDREAVWSTDAAHLDLARTKSRERQPVLNRSFQVSTKHEVKAIGSFGCASASA
jgi:hypothetical protein